MPFSESTCHDLPDGPLPLESTVALADDPTSRALRWAAIVEVSSRGYRDTKVADLIERAGVSRKPFYRRFANKQECVHATAEEVAITALAHAAAQTGKGGGVRALIAATLELAAANPQAARLLIVEAHAAGPPATDARERGMTAYSTLVAQELAPAGTAGGPLLDDVARAIAGALERIVLSRVMAGNAQELPSLTDELSAWALSYGPLLAMPSPLDHEPGKLPPARRRGRAPGTLVPPGPDGRRGLQPGPRRGRLAEVEHSHRDRIFDAVASLVAEGGYDALTTRAVAERAELSIRTLYERFDSLEQAFVATLMAGARGVISATLPEFLARPDPRHGVYAGVRELMTFAAEEQAFAKVMLVQALAAGPVGVEAQRLALDTIASPLVRRFDEADADASLQLVAEAIASGLWELCGQRIRAGQIDQLPAMTPSLACLALTPLVGAERALEAVAEARDAPALG
jgi:AcrR family transcriptional regulator